MVDDLLRIDDIEGTVEHVGIRSTRLRSINGEQIVISNGDLLKSRIHNLGRMPERRVLSRLTVQYESTPEQIAKVSGLVEAAVRATEDARFGSCLLAQLGTYALEFEMIYFVSMRVGAAPSQHTIDAVNRGILQRFTEAGIRLAYPTERQIRA
jgi:small-conductance mechanosensitive channel